MSSTRSSGTIVLIGLLAFVGGLMMLASESETGLFVMVASMVVLWLISTVHHVLLANATPPGETPEAVPRPPSPASR